MSKIKNLARHEQPREKLIEKGVENLRDSELMAILLRTGIEGRDVLKVSDIEYGYLEQIGAIDSNGEIERDKWMFN